MNFRVSIGLPIILGGLGLLLLSRLDISESRRVVLLPILVGSCLPEASNEMAEECIISYATATTQTELDSLLRCAQLDESQFRLVPQNGVPIRTLTPTTFTRKHVIGDRWIVLVARGRVSSQTIAFTSVEVSENEIREGVIRVTDPCCDRKSLDGWHRL